MASRHDIIHIDFQANAGKANVALQSLQREAENARVKMENLRLQLQNARKANLPTADIKKLEGELGVATKEHKQWQQALNNNMKGVRALDEAIKVFNSDLGGGKGHVDSMNAALSKTALNAAKLQQSRSDKGSQTWKEMDALIVALDQNIMKCNTSMNSLVTTIKNGGTASKSTLTQARSDLQQMIALEEQGSNSWKKYTAQLKTVEGELNRVTAEEQRMAGKNTLAQVFRGDYITKSNAEIEKMIASLRQYQSVIKDPEGKGARHFKATETALKKLSEQIAKTKGDVSTLQQALKVAGAANTANRFGSGLDAKGNKMAQAYRKTTEALSQLQQKRQTYTIIQQNGLSLTAQEQAILAKLDAQIASTTARQERLRNEMVKVGEANNLNTKQISQSIQILRQQQETVAVGSPAWQKYEASIASLEQRMKIMRGEAVSLFDAMRLSQKAGGTGFKGTAQQLQLSQQAIERAAATAQKGSAAWTKYQEALARIRVEMQNTGMTSERMRAIMEKPTSAKNLNELQAAVKRAKAELDLMSGTVGKNSKEYANLASQTKKAEAQLKALQAQSHGTASAFEKAWSRLKTYVGLYVGAAVAMQKIIGTLGDIMTLSDKMGEVRKTTGFTADEVGRLSDNLTKLDTRTSLTALMDISAKAGQLGLKTLEDVHGFTQAANMLMVALPEMGQEAATEMMKVALATGEVKKIQKQMDEGLVDGTNAVSVALTKVGSTIDQLRANSAASAPAITDFVKRVGAVGAQSGISIDQVAALGATVDALGMRVEMSATALSRMIPAIKNNAFAIGKAIGVTQTWIEEQFAAGNAMEVILKIFDHIRDANMNAAEIESTFGSSMQDIMKELNQQGARAGIVFAGLSQGVDELRANLGIAFEAYEENIAIANEYYKMNDTAAAKWERLKNQIEESFVGDNAQRGLSVLIDMLRSLVDFITGNVNPALHGLSILTRTFIAYVAMLKIGLGEGLFVSSISRLKEMSSNLMKLIHPSKEYLNLTKALTAAKAAEAAATTTAEKAKAAETVRTLEAKVAQEGLNKAQKANLYTAIAAAAIYAAVVIYRWATSVDKATSSLVKAKEEADKAVARFEGYYATMDKTSVSLQKAQKEHSKLSSEVEKLRNSTDKSSEATAKLKDKEDKLKISENNLTTAKEKHRTSIAEMNKIYGKYLGFLLTEENYANMAALAHNRVADAIEREMLMKQQQAAIEKIRNDNQEDQQKGRSSFYQDLIKKGGLSSTQASQADKALSQMLRGNVRYDAGSDTFFFNKSVYEYLKKRGVDASGASPEKVAALWMNVYLKENFHPNNLGFITGVNTDMGQGGWSTEYTPFVKNLRSDYLSTYFDTMKKEGNVRQTYKSDIEVADESLRKDSQGLINKLLSDSNKAVGTIKKKGKAADINKAYGNLANSIEGLEQQMLSLDPNKDAQLIVKINQTIDNIRRNTDATRLKKAQERIHASLFEQATWSGNETITDLASVGGGSTPNPYGSYNMMDSYDKWDADALVARKKQMLEFVKKLGDGADVQAVLKQDEKFIDEATRKGIKNVRDAIEWYNSERLKIQQELDSRHLTNEGNWKNPRKAKERKKKNKSKQVYSEEAVAELDRYYAWRKEELERQRTEEGVSEAEYNRRVELMEQEHLKKRSDLRRTFTHNETKEEKAAVERFWNWWKSIKELDQDIANEGRVLINNEWKVATARDKAYNDRYAQEDLTSMQAIVVKRMKAIEDIIAKERPYNGITENLEENLTKMGILFADFDKKRREALERGASKDEIDEIERLSGAERFKRLSFLMQEAEHAYTLTWDDLKQRMKEKGLGDLADVIASNENGDRLQMALIAELHQVYDKVQDAVKKESSIIKKHAENIWNDLMPGGDMSMKDSFEKAISDLGLMEDQVKRANGLINAGTASERVTDRLAIKQMEMRLAMQQTYYALMQQEGLKRIAFLKEEQRMEEAKAKRHEAEAKRLREQGKEQEAIREETAAEDAMHRSIQARLDAEHASTSLRLAKTKELAEEEKQRVAIQNQLEESQNRLYTSLREWADLLASSVQSLFEAKHAGDAEYYNELAKLNLTGKGGPGAGTYVVIDNEGTSDAKAHYEYLDERQALERQHEIEQENARAEAWKKVMDDLNQKMSDQITDFVNAMLQQQAVDANTEATKLNTEALKQFKEQLENGVSVKTDSDNNTTPKAADVQYPVQDDNDPSTWPRARRKRAGLPVDENPYDHTQGVTQTTSSTTPTTSATAPENTRATNANTVALNTLTQLISGQQVAGTADMGTGGGMVASADGEVQMQKPFFQMTEEEVSLAMERIQELWQAYNEGGVTALQEMAATLAEMEGVVLPPWQITEEGLSVAMERMGELWQSYAEQGVEALQMMSDAMEEMPNKIPDPTSLTEEHAEQAIENAANMYQGLGQVQIEANKKVTEQKVEGDKKELQSTTEKDKKTKTSTQSTYAAMASAMNMYGLAYQAMSNDNLDATQKFLMFSLQAAGQTAIGMLTTDMYKTEAEGEVKLPGILGEAASQLGPIAGPIAFAAMTALLGGLMGMAMSKVTKAKSQISQVTGASASAGRLATGMLTYAEGNVNEFTDPATLTPGRSYNVDGADGKTYRARYTGKNPRTHITNGPEFHLVGEAGREAIIDAKTTRLLQMDESGIWRTIQTLYNGGSITATRRRRSAGRGMPAFADGNLDDFETMTGGTDFDGGGDFGMSMEQAASLQASIDRQSDLLQDLRDNGIKAHFDVYGRGGLIDSYDRGKKTISSHGERY